jgi:GT2 family glycosyltransferase
VTEADGTPTAGDPRAGAALHGVLVTYRRPAALAEMLDRLGDQRRRLDTLVVVDNDLTESARAAVAAFAGSTTAPGRVDYLPAGANTGPAGGIALGMRSALDHATDDDWVVSLDDDDPPPSVDVFADLERLGRELRAGGEQVGGIGIVGGRFSPDRARAVRVPDEELVGAVRCHWIGGNQFPFYAVGALREVGVFDERLFFGFDDLDFGLRLGAAGYGVFADGELWHRERTRAGRLGVTAEPSLGLEDPSWRRYYSTRNMVYILRNQGHPRGVARLVARSLAKPIVNLPRHPRVAARNLALNTRAIADAFRGRMGLTVGPG